MEEKDPQTEIFEGRWVTDSRTGRQYLVDLKTNKVIMTKNITGQPIPCNEIKSETTDEAAI